MAQYDNRIDAREKLVALVLFGLVLWGIVMLLIASDQGDIEERREKEKVEQARTDSILDTLKKIDEKNLRIIREIEERYETNSISADSAMRILRELRTRHRDDKQTEGR
ncbi:MAG: hypothetical protein ACFB0B_15405 [Thermonemataceae bacterium]